MKIRWDNRIHYSKIENDGILDHPATKIAIKNKENVKHLPQR